MARQAAAEHQEEVEEAEAEEDRTYSTGNTKVRKIERVRSDEPLSCFTSEKIEKIKRTNNRGHSE